MTVSHKDLRRFFALFLIGVSAVAIAYGIYLFRGAFVGAIVLFVLFFPLYNLFTKRWKMHPKLSAALIIIITFFVVLVPVFLVGTLAFREAFVLGQQAGPFIDSISSGVESLSVQFPNLNIQEDIDNAVRSGFVYLRSLLFPLVQGAASAIISVLMMYFLLYFLLTQTAVWERNLYAMLPFSETNSKRLVASFVAVTKSTVVGSGIIAILQGVSLALSFWIAGIPGVFVWGLLAAILSFLPAVGPTVLYIPTSLYFIVIGEFGIGFALLAYNILVTSNIENFLRPLINKEVGKIHPLTSFVGVFFGLYIFGITGLILGPLLISYFFEMVRIYRDEYT